MGKTRVLTGITTTGTPHLGNYVGAIRPAIAAASAPDVDSFLFLADYHALIKCDDPARIERSPNSLRSGAKAVSMVVNRASMGAAWRSPRRRAG